FPFVDSGLVLDITCHDFRPMDLAKLDSKLCSKADHSVGGVDALLSHSTSAKDYPSLHSIVLSVNVYFSILVAYASTSGKAEIMCLMSMGALAYISQLTELHQEYEWSAVLQYHMDYHQLCRREMIQGDYSHWGSRDLDLMAHHLI
ncbi:hypothetical protein C8J56DRAFT_725049, partial [Mycena floridula]